MPQPRVSVLIPVYKAEPFIERCLRSVINQDYPKIELILCDDKTPDEAAALAEHLLRTEARSNIHWHILHNAENMGSAESRRRLLEHSSGAYILWLDSDDYWDAPSNVSTVIQEMQRTEAEVLIMDYYADYQRRRVLHKINCPETGPATAQAILRGDMPGYLWNKCFSRDSFVALHGSFEKGYDILEDFHAVVPFLARTKQVHYLPLAMVHYVQYNTSSLLATMTSDQITKTIAMIDRCQASLMALPHASDYLEAISMAYVNVKAMVFMRSKPSGYGAIRAIHPEVDTLNWSRPAPWYHRSIYALLRRSLTAPLGRAALSTLRVAQRASGR